jgi:hypothetical protein
MSVMLKCWPAGALVLAKPLGKQFSPRKADGRPQHRQRPCRTGQTFSPIEDYNIEATLLWTQTAARRLLDYLDG